MPGELPVGAFDVVYTCLLGTFSWNRSLFQALSIHFREFYFREVVNTSTALCMHACMHYEGIWSRWHMQQIHVAAAVHVMMWAQGGSKNYLTARKGRTLDLRHSCCVQWSVINRSAGCRNGLHWQVLLVALDAFVNIDDVVTFCISFTWHTFLVVSMFTIWRQHKPFAFVFYGASWMALLLKKTRSNARV